MAELSGLLDSTTESPGGTRRTERPRSPGGGGKGRYALISVILTCYVADVILFPYFSIRSCIMNIRLTKFFMALALIFATSAYAQGGYQSNGLGGFYGTGSNAGGGYQSNGMGGIYGTGSNAGGGYQSNGLGGTYGTGSNSGSGWQSNGMGGIHGTGSNAGSGWQSNGMGGYYGTGSNTGRSCQSNGMGGFNCN